MNFSKTGTKTLNFGLNLKHTKNNGDFKTVFTADNGV